MRTRIGSSPRWLAVIIVLAPVGALGWGSGCSSMPPEPSATDKNAPPVAPKSTAPTALRSAPAKASAPVAIGKETWTQIDGYDVQIDEGATCSSVSEPGAILATKSEAIVRNTKALVPGAAAATHAAALKETDLPEAQASRVHLFRRDAQGSRELVAPRDIDVMPPTQSVALPRLRGEYAVGFIAPLPEWSADGTQIPRVRSALQLGPNGWVDMTLPEDVIAYQIHVLDVTTAGIAVGTVRTVGEDYQDDRGFMIQLKSKRTKAFVWDGTYHFLPGADNTAATAISQNGRFVSGMITEDGHARAALWRDGAITLLGPAGPSEAFDVNDSGVVVGYVGDRFHSVAAVFDEATATPLGTLGGPQSWASTVTRSGLVFGSSDAKNGRHAFAWDGHTMTDLNPSGATTSSWVTDSTPDGDALVGRGITRANKNVCIRWTRSAAANATKGGAK